MSVVIGSRGMSETDRLLANIKEMVGRRPTILELGRQNLNEESAFTVASVLKSNNTVQTLNLENNEIGKTGSTVIANALEGNTTLTTLNIRGNKIGPVGLSALLKMLQKNTTLKVLNISENGITEDGASDIADCLKCNSSLKKLICEWNGFNEESAVKFLQGIAFNCSLTHLNLCGNVIGPNGAELLAEGIQKNWTLQYLSLRANKIEDVGAVALAKMLEVNSALLHLDVEDNNITDVGGAAFGQSLKGNRKLTVLNIKGGNYVSDKYCYQIDEIMIRNYETAQGKTSKVIGMLANWFRSVGESIPPTDEPEIFLQIACKKRFSGVVASAFVEWVTVAETFPNFTANWTDEDAVFLIKSICAHETNFRFHRDASGRSIVHWLASSENFPPSPESFKEILGLLHSSGCDSSTKDFHYSTTPLMRVTSREKALAFIEGNVDTDIYSCDCFGHSITQWLSSSWCEDILRKVHPKEDGSLPTEADQYKDEVIIIVCPGDGCDGCSSCSTSELSLCAKFVDTCIRKEELLCGGCKCDTCKGNSVSPTQFTSKHRFSTDVVKSSDAADAQKYDASNSYATLAYAHVPVETFPTRIFKIKDKATGEDRNIAVRFCDAMCMTRQYLEQLGKSKDRNIVILNIFSMTNQNALQKSVQMLQSLLPIFPKAIVGLLGINIISPSLVLDQKMCPVSKDAIYQTAKLTKSHIYGVIDSVSSVDTDEPITNSNYAILLDHKNPDVIFSFNKAATWITQYALDYIARQNTPVPVLSHDEQMLSRVYRHPLRPLTTLRETDAQSFLEGHHRCFVQEIVGRPAPLLVEDAGREYVKVVIIGHSNTGKTSIARCIGNPSYRADPLAKYEKTLGAEETIVDFGRNLKAKIFDIGTDFLYLGFHDILLTPNNTVFVIVVDGTDMSSTNECARHLYDWLTLLSQVLSSLCRTCKIVVVYNKLDVIATQYPPNQATEIANARSDAAVRILQTHYLLDCVQHDFVFVSCKNGDGLFTLRSVIHKHVRSIAAKRIPRVYNEALARITHFSERNGFFTTFGKIKALLTEGLPFDFQALKDQVPSYYLNVLGFLFDNGALAYDRQITDALNSNNTVKDVFEHLDKRIFCTNAVLLSKIIAVLCNFNCIGYMEDKQGCAIFDQSQIQDILACHIPECSNMPHFQRVIKMLCQLGLLVPLSDSKYYLPLRPPCSSLITMAKPDENEDDEIYAMDCLAWRCSNCGNFVKAQQNQTTLVKPLRCNRCFKVDTFVQSCISSCPCCALMRDKCDCIPRFVRINRSNKTIHGCVHGSNFEIPLEEEFGCNCMRRIPDKICVTAEMMNPSAGTEFTLSSWVSLLKNLRRRTRQQFPLFRNGGLFTDCYNNSISITIVPQSDLLSQESWIHPLSVIVVARGVVPWMWKETLPEFCVMGSFVQLCPKCAIAEVVNKLKKKPQSMTHSSSHGGTTSRTSLIGKTRSSVPRSADQTPAPIIQYICPEEHGFTAEEYTRGMIYEPAPGSTQFPWMPKCGKEFFMESMKLKKWTPCPVCEMRITSGTRSKGIVISYSELTSDETTPARYAEFSRARNLFYKGIGPKHAAEIELQKIYFIYPGLKEDYFLSSIKSLSHGAKSSAWRMTGSDLRVGSNLDICLGWQGMTEEECHQMIMNNVMRTLLFSKTVDDALECAAQHVVERASKETHPQTRKVLVASWVVLEKEAGGRGSTFHLRDEKAPRASTVFDTTTGFKGVLENGETQILLQDSRQCLPTYIFVYEETPLVEI